MSEWTHVICDECWYKIEPQRIPVRLVSGDPQPCCWCGGKAKGDILRREDPAKVPNCVAR